LSIIFQVLFAGSLIKNARNRKKYDRFFEIYWFDWFFYDLCSINRI